MINCTCNTTNYHAIYPCDMFSLPVVYAELVGIFSFFGLWLICTHRSVIQILLCWYYGLSIILGFIFSIWWHMYFVGDLLYVCFVLWGYMHLLFDFWIYLIYIYFIKFKIIYFQIKIRTCTIIIIIIKKISKKNRTFIRLNDYSNLHYYNFYYK